MTTKHLAGVLDGGPHEDPREAEDETLLNDGEEEEGGGTGVKNDEEEWSEEEFSEAGKAEKLHAKGKVEKEEVKKEEEEEEPTKEEKRAEELEKDDEEQREREKDEGKGEKVEEEEEEHEDPKTQYKTIPYKRFKQELTKRKELALRALQAEERAKAVEDRLKRFEEAAQKASDPEPDRNLDPLAHQDWRIRQLEAQKAQTEQKAQQPQRSEALQRFVHTQYQESAAEFAEEHADFNDAYRFVLDTVAAGVIRQYPEATQEQVNQYIRQLELNAAYNELNAGRDPAALVYAEAQRMGFKPKGGQRVDKKDRIVSAIAEETARKRASTIAGKGQRAERKELTIDDVEDMSNEELARFYERNSGRTNPLRA